MSVPKLIFLKDTLTKFSRNGIFSKLGRATRYEQPTLKMEGFPASGVVHPYRDDRVIKLLMINNKFNILAPKQAVLDLGFGTGSWSQFIYDTIKPNIYPESMIISCDIEPVKGLKGIHLLDEHDFTEKTAQEKIKDILAGRKLDVIVSDIEPRRCLNMHDYHVELVRVALKIIEFGFEVLNKDATVVFRMSKGQYHPSIITKCKRNFKFVDSIITNDTADTPDKQKYIVMTTPLTEEEKANLKPNKGYVPKKNVEILNDEVKIAQGLGDLNKTDYEQRVLSPSAKIKFENISSHEFNSLFEENSTNKTTKSSNNELTN